jgi:hypothetical protein
MVIFKYCSLRASDLLLDFKFARLYNDGTKKRDAQAARTPIKEARKAASVGVGRDKYADSPVATEALFLIDLAVKAYMRRQLHQ